MPFLIDEYIEEQTNGRIEVEVKESIEDEQGRSVAYEIVPAETQKGKIKINLNLEVFEPATKAVAKALCKSVLKDKAKSEAGKRVLQSFIDRTGRYEKLGIRERVSSIKENLKKINDIRTISYIEAMVDVIANHPKGDVLADQLDEARCNWEIYH